MSASYPYPIIAREGWPFLAAAVIVAAVVTWLVGWWAAPVWLAALFVLQFFRDPARQVPGGAGTAASPADGRVIAVEGAGDTYLDRNATMLRVLLTILTV